MRKGLWKLGSALIWGIVEVLLFYPILLLLSPLPGLEDSFPLWVAALPLYMPVGTLMRLVLRWELRIVLILISGVVLAGGTWLAYGVSFEALGALAAGSVLYYHGFRLARTPWHQILPVGLFWISLIFYMAGGAILTRIPTYDAYSSSLGWLGAVALVLTLFLANTSNLKQETHSGQRDVRLASGVLLKNRILIGLLLAVVLLIGYIRPLMDLVASFKQWLLDLINAWLHKPDKPSGPLASSAPQTDTPMPGGADQDPSAFAKFMDKLLLYLGAVVTIAIAAAMLYYGGKWLIRGVRRLAAWLRERGMMGEQGVQDYEEEKAALFTWSEFQDQMRDRFAGFVSRFQRDPDWESLSGAERMRLLYRLYVRRSAGAGRPPEAHLTAREQLLAGSDPHLTEASGRELAEAYEAVRYGERPADGTQATRLKKDAGL